MMVAAGTIKSYSQYGEDVAILEHVGSEVGRFLDVGAFHATDKSNTRALYERGWGGLMIEPSPEPFLGLLKAYGNDDRIMLLNAAVGLERFALKMHATADAVTTSNEQVYQTWKHEGGYYGSFYTVQITIEEISNQFGGFEFVNFDAEGCSVDLCRRYLELGHRPRCMCVEHDGRLVELLQDAHKAGFKAVQTNGTNVVLAR